MSLPGAIQIEARVLRDLSIECWRLARAADATPDAPNRAAILRVARSISEILARCEVEIVDLAGRTYDPGFVAEVVDVTEEPSLGEHEVVVDETIVPTLLFRGQILDRGQIVVRRAPRTLRKEAVE